MSALIDILYIFFYLQIELLTPKQNGSMDDDQEKKNPSTIRGMWKKAFKTLKSSSSVEKLVSISVIYNVVWFYLCECQFSEIMHGRAVTRLL